MKTKLLYLLLMLSIAACGGRNESAAQTEMPIPDQAIVEGSIVSKEAVVSDTAEEPAQATDANSQPAASAPAEGGERRMGGQGSLIARFDTNGNGVLQASEAPENLNFEALDKNADGVIDSTEIGRLLDGSGNGGRPQNIPQRNPGDFVAQFDLNGDGLISAAEAPEAWPFPEYDVNGDGVVDEDEATQIRLGGNRNPNN